MTEHYIELSGKDIKDIKSSLKSQAKIAKRYQMKNIQSNRFMRDAVVGNLLGVTRMNTCLHGWDGRFDNGMPFENKNVTSSAKGTSSYSLNLKDTSEAKLMELVQNGVICSTSFWGEGSEPDFIILGNTKNVGDQLIWSYNPDARKSCSAGLVKCLDNGFKVVALNYDKEQTLATISNVFPSIGQKMTFDDVYTAKDIASLVEEMMVC